MGEWEVEEGKVQQRCEAKKGYVEQGDSVADLVINPFSANKPDRVNPSLHTVQKHFVYIYSLLYTVNH